jgi:hypothetical protein
MTDAVLSAQYPVASLRFDISEQYPAKFSAPIQEDASAPILDEASASMIESLAADIVDCKNDAAHCSSVLEVLIDIATYKKAPDAALHAEKKLLTLYGDPGMPQSLRDKLIGQ